MKASRCCGTVAIWTGWLGEQRTEHREMSSGLEVQRPSRRDLMRQCGNVALGVAGTGRACPAGRSGGHVSIQDMAAQWTGCVHLRRPCNQDVLSDHHWRSAGPDEQEPGGLDRADHHVDQSARGPAMVLERNAMGM